MYVKAFESYCITACECVHLVKCGHFRSRDNDDRGEVARASPRRDDGGDLSATSQINAITTLKGSGYSAN